MKKSFLYTIIFSCYLFTFSSCNYFQEKKRKEERDSTRLQLKADFKTISNKYKAYTFINDNIKEKYSYELEKLLIESNSNTVFIGEILDIEKKDLNTYIIHILMDEYIYHSQCIVQLKANSEVVKKIEKFENADNCLLITRIISIRTIYRYDPQLSDYDIFEKEIDNYSIEFEMNGTYFMNGTLLNLIELPYYVDIEDFENE